MAFGRSLVLFLGSAALATFGCGDDGNDGGNPGGTSSAGKGAGSGQGGLGGGGRTGAGAGGSAGTAVSSGGIGTAGAGVGAVSGAGPAGSAGAGGASSGSGGSAGTAGSGDSGGSANGGEATNAGAGSDGGTSTGSSTYDEAVLADGPVAYWAMNGSGTETDLTGNGHTGTYHGDPDAATLPNGDQGAAFDGQSQYLSVPSHAALSIPTTKSFTWEAWIRPDTLEFQNDSDGYVDWMGKCEGYAPDCEWEARMYSQTNSQDRCNRLSAYAFNPSAGLGSGAYWEAEECGTIEAGGWYHVVGEYSTEVQSGNCDSTSVPGSIDIWVNGVKWNQASHGDTGCMAQYDVVPEARPSPLNIGTMSQDAWFEGAIAKVAIYDVRLSDAKIKQHYELMTGDAPTGSCDSLCSF